MSSPAEFYNSLPPVSKAYGTLCLLTTALFQLNLFDLGIIALLYQPVFTQVQVWRLFTNFFFLGKFSINFGIRLLMIARYGVQLEKGPFDKRTADFLWMMLFGAFFLLVLSAIPFFWSPFLGTSMVFMLLYLWSREFPTAQINIYGLVTLKAFYLPWAMLMLDIIFGSPIMPSLLGIVAGHLYYFLTVLHPLASGRNLLKTPAWVHKLVALLGWGVQSNSGFRPNSTNTATGLITGKLKDEIDTFIFADSGVLMQIAGLVGSSLYFQLCFEGIIYTGHTHEAWHMKEYRLDAISAAFIHTTITAFMICKPDNMIPELPFQNHVAVAQSTLSIAYMFIRDK
ncbi:hypothetical protein OPV22_020408 [Ensete ventricosum]|uniref:Derlin n=1 Tax=Ensete ventricosum TaxID=4639 RepID=A0AAV8QEA6_ENSVE|nr:hypothetical protein OPV22_020408 [Ensete ventricosum]